MRLWDCAVLLVLVALPAASACEGDAPCRCTGDVLGDAIDVACGETFCAATLQLMCRAHQDALELGPCPPDEEDAAVPDPTPVCTNDCRFAEDGECDDGGDAAGTSLCTLGSDCTDCGERIVSGGCIPDCRTRSCGLDPMCGVSCGSCETGWRCAEGICAEDCSALGEPCTSRSDCCGVITGEATCEEERCCVPNGGSCSDASECCAAGASCELNLSAGTEICLAPES